MIIKSGKETINYKIKQADYYQLTLILHFEFKKVLNKHLIFRHRYLHLDWAQKNFCEDNSIHSLIKKLVSVS